MQEKLENIFSILCIGKKSIIARTKGQRVQPLCQEMFSNPLCDQLGRNIDISFDLQPSAK